MVQIPTERGRILSSDGQKPKWRARTSQHLRRRNPMNRRMAGDMEEVSASVFRGLGEEVDGGLQWEGLFGRREKGLT